MATIYLDMDGVVADFDAKVEEITGIKRQPYTRYPDEEWNKILQHPRFYRDLPLCANANHLVTMTLHMAHHAGMDVKFLSALPKGNDFPWAPYDKFIWAQRHFPNIPVWLGPYSEDKQIRAKEGEVLIDDRKVNIDQWIQKGGFGILHRGDVSDTINKLKEFLF